MRGPAAGLFAPLSNLFRPIGNGCTLLLQHPIGSLLSFTNVHGCWHQPFALPNDLDLRGVILSIGDQSARKSPPRHGLDTAASADPRYVGWYRAGAFDWSRFEGTTLPRCNVQVGLLA